MEKEFGIIGLGKIGGNIARLAVEKGFRVVGHDLQPDESLREAGVELIETLARFKDSLQAPRRIFLWTPSGKPVDEICDALSEHLEPGDAIIDGGNSYWGDSKRRHARYAEKQIDFLDMGTSGGVEGARYAPCFMIGGPRPAVEKVEPLLKALAVKDGYVHAGTQPGAGHFVKLVHNGIEFGMLQAIAEGMDLLHHYPEKLDIEATLDCWRHGSVIRSWLIDLVHRAYQQDPQSNRPTRYIEDTGEVNWLVGDAMNLDVAVPVIAQSVMMLMKSRDATGVANKAIIQMRHEFGGHPMGADEAIRRERKKGRVGPLWNFT